MDTVIKIDFPGRKVVGATLGKHLVRTDQPVASGGEDGAPSPFDLFLAAIGTCAGSSAAAFCQSRGIATDDLDLEMVCTRHASEHRYEKIALRLRVPTDFPDKYRIGIERAMNLCSVKRHIMQPPEFELSIE